MLIRPLAIKRDWNRDEYCDSAFRVLRKILTGQIDGVVIDERITLGLCETGEREHTLKRGKTISFWKHTDSR